MSSSSSYPFTFRVDHQLDSTPGSSSSSSAGQPRGRPLSKEDKRRLRQQRQADGELDDPSDGSRSRDEKKRGWIGWGQKDQDDRQGQPAIRSIKHGEEGSTPRQGVDLMHGRQVDGL